MMAFVGNIYHNSPHNKICCCAKNMNINMNRMSWRESIPILYTSSCSHTDSICDGSIFSFAGVSSVIYGYVRRIQLNVTICQTGMLAKRVSLIYECQKFQIHSIVKLILIYFQYSYGTRNDYTSLL